MFVKYSKSSAFPWLLLFVASCWLIFVLRKEHVSFVETIIDKTTQLAPKQQSSMAQLQHWVKTQIREGCWVNNEFMNFTFNNSTTILNRTVLESRMTSEELAYFHCALAVMPPDFTYVPNGQVYRDHMSICQSKAVTKLQVTNERRNEVGVGDFLIPFYGPVGDHPCFLYSAKEISQVGYWRFSQRKSSDIPNYEQLKLDGLAVLLFLKYLRDLTFLCNHTYSY